MGKRLTMEEIAELFNIVPMEGERDVDIVRSRQLEEPSNGEMTEEDWDRFEKDIHDAFEQIP